MSALQSLMRKKSTSRNSVKSPEFHGTTHGDIQKTLISGQAQNMKRKGK